MEQTLNVEPVQRGQEAILLVEDEPAILTLVATILATQGYTVLPAQSPQEAIALASKHTGVISLLLTDVAMPEMNGWELANHILRHDHRLKRLFMSGHPFDIIAPHCAINERGHFIQKPFTVKSLSLKVREILDSD